MVVMIRWAKWEKASFVYNRAHFNLLLVSSFSLLYRIPLMGEEGK
jgi:hypothetical protein